MLYTLIKKELRSIVLSPKFIGTFIVCSFLILLSIYTGIREYRAMSDRYHAASLMVEEEKRQITTWGRMNDKVYREPDPMQIFVSGLDYDIGRWSLVSMSSPAKLSNSAYSDDPIFAVFRVVDFSFITRFVLTLFAILFTYNAINGERENGTLKLVFSNSVSRVKYIIGKCLGAWLGLTIPISIPILLGLLLLVLFAVPLSVSHWIRIILLLILSQALFTLFIIFGVLLSTLTRRSSVSFLIGLVTWVTLVTIIPAASVMAAGQLVHVPRMAEIESQKSGFAQEKWQNFYADMDERWNEYNASANIDGEQNEDLMWSIMEREDSLRREIREEIYQYGLRLQEDLQQRKIHQEKIAYMLSRLSPVAAYQLGAMRLAGTDTELKNRYESAINHYSDGFFDHVKEKQAETGVMGGIMMSISLNEDGSQNISTTRQRNKEVLDLSGLPEFQIAQVTLAESANGLAVDFGIILLFTLVSLAGAFTALLKYDVR